MDDLLDLFGDRKSSSEQKENDVAPVELMTQFLVLISERKMPEALALTSEILEFEPNNAMILEYRRSITIYIQQLKDEGEDEESVSEEEKSEADDESEEEESESETEAEDRKTSHK